MKTAKKYVDIWKIETRDECIESPEDCEKLLSGDAGDAPSRT